MPEAACVELSPGQRVVVCCSSSENPAIPHMPFTRLVCCATVLVGLPVEGFRPSASESTVADQARDDVCCCKSSIEEYKPLSSTETHIVSDAGLPLQEVQASPARPSLLVVGVEVLLDQRIRLHAYYRLSHDAQRRWGQSLRRSREGEVVPGVITTGCCGTCGPPPWLITRTLST